MCVNPEKCADKNWPIRGAFESTVEHQRRTDLVKGESGSCENVRRGGAEQIPGRATFLVRFANVFR
jgi:hypothetical protein